MTVFGIQIEILTGVGIPAGAAAFFIARHFWEKTKCFHLMKQKIEDLSKADEGSHETHSDLYDKVNKIERNLFHLMGKMNVKPID